MQAYHAAMNMLSAFADEIDDDPAIQIRELERNKVHSIELRGAWGKNVLSLSANDIRNLKQQAADHGIGFSALGSPLGKFPLLGNFQEQLDSLHLALEYAEILDAPYIRVFSFYPPEGESVAAYRNQDLEWLGAMTEVATTTSTKLAHENERNIYGDTGDRVLDLIISIDSPSLVCTFDFSNFVQCGERPYQDCWVKLKSHLGYFHIKDSLPDGTVVPAGQGTGDLARILAEAFADGFSDYLTLEPHLKPLPGRPLQSKADRFATAAQALHGMLARIPGSESVLKNSHSP